MASSFLQIFGGLVWILVAGTLVVPANPQAWVMFVSVFCFVVTFIWMVVFACGGHRNHSSWATAVSSALYDCMGILLPFHTVFVSVISSIVLGLCCVSYPFQFFIFYLFNCLSLCSTHNFIVLNGTRNIKPILFNSSILFLNQHDAG